MKTITATELKNILDSHALWIRTVGAEGTRAYLQGLNLRYANLSGAYLFRANLESAYLEHALLPKKELAVGKLYNLWSFIHVYPHSEVGTETLVCLLSIDEQNQTLEYIEAVSGEMRRSQPNWHKYSFIEAKE